VAVLFPRPETRTGNIGGADRQVERGAGGAVRRGVSGRASLAQWLARHRPDQHRRGVDRIQALGARPDRGCDGHLLQVSGLRLPLRG